MCTCMCEFGTHVGVNYLYFTNMLVQTLQREGSYEHDYGFDERKHDGHAHDSHAHDGHARTREAEQWEHDLYEGEEDREGGVGGGDLVHVEPGPVVMLRNLRDDVHKEDVRMCECVCVCVCVCLDMHACM